MTPPSDSARSAPAPLLQLLRRVLAELIGAALFSAAVLTGGWLAAQGLIPELLAQTGVPALSILALIYALSDVSGAHFNPAVTLAFALRGSFPWRRVLPYWAAQIGGAALAATLLSRVLTLPHGSERVSAPAAFTLEALCSLLLVMVVLATADRKASIGTQSALAVTGTLALAHVLANPLTALALNPARVLGVYVASGRPGISPHLWGPFLGAVVACGLVWVLRGPVPPEGADAAQGDQGEVDTTEQLAQEGVG